MSLRADIEKYRKQVLETNDPAQRKAAFLNYLTLSWYAETTFKKRSRNSSRKRLPRAERLTRHTINARSTK